MRLHAAALLFLVVTAGCVSVGPLPRDGGLQPREDVTVTVTHVVDGDTLEVRYPDGDIETVRLLGVDSPEVHEEPSPTEYEGVPDTEAGRACLREAGRNATDWLIDRVGGEYVTLVFDPRADERGDYGRLLAYVEQNETDLNYRLVATGHARVFVTDIARIDRYLAAEADARAAGDGLWRCAS